MIAKQLFYFRADRICGILALGVAIHGHDAAGVYREIGRFEPLRNLGVVIGGDEGGVVIRDYANSTFSQAVNDVVRVDFPPTQVKSVANSTGIACCLRVGDAFQNKGMHPVASLFVGAGQAFIKKHRDSVFVGDLDCILQCVVTFDPTIHLGPVEDEFPARDSGCIIQFADAIVHASSVDKSVGAISGLLNCGLMPVLARRAHLLVALVFLGLPLSAQAPVTLFPNYEQFDYQIEWRIWNAGHAHLEWTQLNPLKNDRESKVHIDSIGVVSRLFHVNDDYRAQMNGSLCTSMIAIIAREGSRSRDTKVTFDATQRKAVFNEKDLNTNTVVHREIEIPSCVHDIVGALYALRSMNLEPGKTTGIAVSNGRKSTVLRVEAQAREEIKLNSAMRKAIRYEVFAFDNQLYSRSGHLHVWLSDDARRIPLQFEIRLQFTIGTITLRLDKES